MMKRGALSSALTSSLAVLMQLRLQRQGKTVKRMIKQMEANVSFLKECGPG
jgi:hypothetical protein